MVFRCLVDGHPLLSQVGVGTEKTRLETWLPNTNYGRVVACRTTVLLFSKVVVMHSVLRQVESERETAKSP